jgi:hypothetical protein
MTDLDLLNGQRLLTEYVHASRSAREKVDHPAEHRRRVARCEAARDTWQHWLADFPRYERMAYDRADPASCAWSPCLSTADTGIALSVALRRNLKTSLRRTKLVTDNSSPAFTKLCDLHVDEAERLGLEPVSTQV